MQALNVAGEDSTVQFSDRFRGKTACSEPATPQLGRSPSETAVLRLGPEEMSGWDSFVESHPLGTVFHTSAWCRVLEKAFPHIKGYFLALVERQTGNIRAGLPVYSVFSYLLGNRLVSVPFASFCDPLVGTAAELGMLLPSIKKLQDEVCARKCEFRPWQATGLLERDDLQTSQIFKHHTLSLDAPLEEIRKGFSRTCVRQWISRAERNGISIRIGSGKNDFGDFFRTLLETRQRLSLPPIPYRYFDAIQTCLPADWVWCINAMRDGEPLAGALALRFRGVCSLEYAGESSFARKAGAGKLMYWETIRQAHRSGCTVFSFGRTSESNKGLGAYKRHWGATESDLPVYTMAGRATSEKIREETSLYRTVRWLSGRAPHSLYMWLGQFCYRHMG